MKLTRQQFLRVLPATVLALSGCAASETAPASTEELVFDHACPLDYATQFTADCYEGGYTMLTLTESGQQFLVTPEDAAAVEGLPESVTVLRQPVRNIYLVSTSVMDLFVHLDALDSIALSGTKAEGWYVEEAKQAMQEGRIAYAGKYSAPDYERILAVGCTLAIENTMVLHDPEVKEQLAQLRCGTLRGLDESLELLTDVADSIGNTIKEEPAGTLKEGGIIRNGANEVVDELRLMVLDGKEWLAKAAAAKKSRV